MTSGAIQQGVPTNVFRTLFLVMSPPAARKALTPKSGECVRFGKCDRRDKKKKKQFKKGILITLYLGIFFNKLV